ncbi:MAG: glycosyltransferase family 4 protein [Bryobacteraceae bacterium]
MIRSPIRRLLMTCDTVGGVWTFALELAEAFSLHGIEVLLACLGGAPSERQQYQARRLANVQLAESRYRLEWMRDPWRDVAESGDWLLDLADRFEPDLVHLNSFGHGALGWQAPTVLTAHSCVWSWWAAVRGGSPDPEWQRYWDVVVQSLEAVDVVTVPSRAMRECLRQNYGVASDEIRVVANGRTPELFFCGTKEPLIFAAGRLWDEGKNIAALARVAGRLSWPCAIAGEHRHPDGAKTAFEGCRMLGVLPQKELATWYARASIYALPARYEPFGFSALEAALSGCALVLGDIPSLREIWGDAAIFVSPDDEDALAEALKDFIRDPQLRNTMAGRSAVRARRFTPEAMVRGYLDAYESAANYRRAMCVS